MSLSSKQKLFLITIAILITAAFTSIESVWPRPATASGPSAPPPPPVMWEIRNDATGGDCAEIGEWDAAHAICNVNRDLVVTISGAIGLTLEDGTSLNGNGHFLVGRGLGLYSGVSLYGVSNVAVVNLRISGFAYGAAISASRNVYMSGNVFNGNLNDLWIYGESDDQYQHEIDASNLIEEKPVYYLKDARNHVIDGSSIGSLYCIRCSGMTFRGINFDVGGVLLWKTVDSVIETSTFSAEPLSLVQSSGNTARGNLFTGSGIHCSACNGNVFSNNRMMFPVATGDGSYNPLPIGISFVDSHDNQILNNYISGGDVGINSSTITISSQNIIAGNTIVGSRTMAIQLWYSTASVIRNNMISDCGGGIMIYSSDNNKLTGNVVTSSGNDISTFSGIGISGGTGNGMWDNRMSGNRFNLSLSQPYDNEIDTSNLVDGKPVYVLTGARDYVFPPGAGAVFCKDCSNITVRNLDLSHNSHGLHLSGCTGCLVENVDAHDNGYGLLIDNSDSVEIRNSRSWDNVYSGIGLNHVTGSTLQNDVSIRNEDGLTSWYSSGNFILGGIYSENRSGVMLADSSSNRIEKNVIGSNTEYGIHLSGNTTAGNKIINNSFLGNNLQALGGYGSDQFYEEPPVGGNYWDDYDTQEEGCVDAGGDGFCDSPYMQNAWGTWMQVDPYPWTTPGQWPDVQAPVIRSVGPEAIVDRAEAEIRIEYFDDVDVDVASVIVSLDGIPLQDCEVAGTAATCQTHDLSYGRHTVTAFVSDTSGNSANGGNVFYRSHSYYFSWYDSNPAWGMLGDWICVTNLSQDVQEPTRVEVLIGEEKRLVASFDLGVGPGLDQKQWISPWILTGGPVEVRSSNGRPLLVSKRTIYRDSFNEINAIDQEDLDSEYLFSWYDNDPAHGMNGDWICVANPGTELASIEIFIGEDAQPAAAFQLGAGSHLEWQSRDVVTAGPVRVVSTGGQPILASQRVVYKETFTETPGTPRSGLQPENYFTFYDNNPDWGMAADWIMITNAGDAATEAQVYIGDMAQAVGAGRIEPGETIPWISEKIRTGGPVKVVSPDGQSLLVSQRVLYKDSFEEIPATGADRLDWQGMFNWYDTTWMNSWIMLGKTAGSAPRALISINHEEVYDERDEMEAQLVPQPGQARPFFFPSSLAGPVQISFPDAPQERSTVMSQRVIYRNSFNEVPAVYSPFTGSSTDLPLN